MCSVRVSIIVLISALVLLTAGCIHAGFVPSNADSESARWIPASQVPARGVVLIVHGLNLRPSAMDELGTHFAQEGFHSYRVALRGHAHDEEGTFPAQAWRDDIVAGYSLARTTYPELPLHIIGYSAGGLVVTDVIAHNRDVRPASMALLAPALSLRTYVQIASILSLFPPLSWRVPNVAPVQYRRFNTTPLFWYSNVLEFYDATRSISHPESLRDIPTQVFLSPDDELVSASGVVEWIADHGLQSSWQVVEITPKPTNESSFEHLIIDKGSLGEEEWQRTVDVILGLFMRHGSAERPMERRGPP